MPKLIKSKECFFGFLIFIFALTLRLAYHFFLQANYFFVNHPSTDVVYYQEWAYQIAMGDWIGHKTFFGLPLYPYFLAVIKGLSLGNEFVMRFFHMTLGSINCVLIYLIAKRIFSFNVALLAALLMATNYVLIYYDWLMMPVPLLIFLSLIILYALLHAATLNSKREWFILGILIGLLILGDGKILIFSILTILYLFLTYKRNRAFKLKTIFMPLLCGIFIILFSVTLRNRMVGGDWVFISAQSGLSFFAGNNQMASGIYENPDFIRPTHQGQDEDQRIVAEAIARKTLSPAEISQFWRNKALTFIQEHPIEYTKLLIRKITLFLTDTEKAHDIDLILQREWRQIWNVNPYFLICPLGLAGMFLAQRHGKQTIFLNLMVISQLVMTLIFFLTTRHRTTILPLLIIYESYFFCWFIEQCRIRNVFSISLTLVGCILYFLTFRPQSLDADTLAFTIHAKSGPVYEKQQQYLKAREEYLLALEYRPYDTNTLYNLGNAYYHNRQIKEAEASYLKAIQSCHYNVDALYNLGYLYEELHAFEQALEYYEKVLEFQPQSFDVQYRIANIYLELNDCQKVQTSFATLTRIRPEYAEELRNILIKCF